MIKINITKQVLEYIFGDEIVKKYSISSSKKGPGQQKNSFCTPTGKHIIRAKIGKSVPCYGVFKGRRFSGDLWDCKTKSNISDDLILSRILWLSGIEVGINRLGNVDTMQRYIYIHGTHDEERIGQPVSHGCIRMTNADVVELFDLVKVGESVIIFNE
jgi:hypothetical protein